MFHSLSCQLATRVYLYQFISNRSLLVLAGWYNHRHIVMTGICCRLRRKASKLLQRRLWLYVRLQHRNKYLKIRYKQSKLNLLFSIHNILHCNFLCSSDFCAVIQKPKARLSCTNNIPVL